MGKGKRGPPKGVRYGGRKKGTPNKVSSEVKQGLLDSFVKLGGTNYLVWLGRHEPKAYASLLSRLLPHEVVGASGGPVEHRIGGTVHVYHLPDNGRRSGKA